MRSSGGLVCQGIIDGTNGTDGYNTVVVPLYRRSASVLTDNNRPSGPLTYTFSTGRLTGASTYFNGWSQTIPTASANTKLYVIMAVARSQSDTDEIAATDWSTPVEYVADGMSSAPVFIYKRAASQPTDKPADGAVYTFATGALTGTLNGWSTNIPATDNNHYPCWVRQAMAVSRGTTDTINADEWSNPATKLVEDGASITKKSETYRYATNNTGVCPAANSADWSTTKPTLQKGYWLFTETTITWSDDSTTVLYTAERNPNDGISGQDIIVDGATVMKYYVGDSNSTHPAEGSNDWKDLSQVTQTKGKWLWSKATTYYRKASSSAGAHDAGYTVTYNVTYIALDGTTPEAARGIESVTEYYKATNSSTPMSKPSSDDGWSTDPNLSDLTNKWGESYKYLWNFEKVTYNKAPLVERTIPQIVAIWTKDGGTGGAGRGIDSIQNYYKVTNSSTAPSKPSTPGTDGWSTTPTAPGQGQYLWNYEVITWVNPSDTTETDVQLIGYAGTNGAQGYSIALTLIRNNLYTDANWNTYAELGHSENYSKRTGDSDFTACRVSDYFVVTGTSSDSGKNHTAIYKCTSVNANSITGTCVSHTKDGENGDDAVTYQIVFSEAWAKVDASNVITARLRGYAYKIVGNTRTAMSSATIRIGYILNNSNTYVEITTNSSGYFTEDNWFNGDTYGESGYSQGSQVIFAAIIVGTGVMCVEYVTMTFAGAKGDTGRMYYIAGEFPKKAPYSRTDKLCPVVYYGGEWWYLDVASATGSDTPSDSSTKWKKLQNYGVVLTDAIFVKNFAQFGAAIITGDWLISIHGMIGNTYYGGSVENPDEYNNRAAYTYFDPAYPWGYDPFQLPVIEEDVETDQYHEWTRLTNNFKLPAGTYTFNISCYVNSSDSMHLRLFNGDESSDALYLGGTSSDELVTLTYTKTLTSSQYWNLRATMNAAGEVGCVTAVEVIPSDPRFIPNYAVDLRTGKTYQSDAHIKGAIQCIGPTSKVTIEDGVIRMFGAMSFPNIVLGVNEDGCAVLNFYDKNGNFKYGLGPDEIFRTKSQAESMTLKYYDVDAGSEDCTSLLNSAVVMLYLYMFKNQITNALVNGSLYKYLAKIASGVYGPGSYCASSADAQKYNEKIIKNGYSASAKLKDSDVYSNGGIVVTSSRTTCGIINKLSNMLNGESVDDLDYRGYNVMQDSDFNKTKEGTTYYFRTKDTYNPVQAFYWDSSYPSSSAGGIGYGNAYSDKYWLNLCTNPADDETLIDPVYYFNLMCIDSTGTNKGYKTLYINRSKLQAILHNAGYSL